MNILRPIVNCIVIFFIVNLFAGCKKDNNDLIGQQLHGQYKIISAIANQYVDVDLDNRADKNLLLEIPALKYAFLELITKGNSTFIFSQFWQNQYFQGVEGLPVSYNPSVIINYMNQATVANFVFNPHNKTLDLTRENADPAFPLPKSVELNDDNTIKIKMEKRLYTKAGWVNVDIIVIYEKFNASK